MLTEKQFEMYLWNRRFQSASTNLAERIIAAAKNKPVVATAGIMGYVRDILDTIIPKPMYAIAFVLVIGILIGANLSVQTDDREEFALTTDEGEL